MNKVLITGASGFIGRRLVEGLKGKNSSIIVLSRSNQIDLETVICDFETDPIPLKSMTGVGTVFHLAAFAHDFRVTSKVQSFYEKINIDATILLAELAAQSGVERFIFVSSVKAGGTAVNGKCMTEKDQNEPEGVYGKTKREAELRLLEISRRSSMNVTILRPSLVYGPNMKGNLALMLSRISKGVFPPLPQIRNIRSMIHVDDLVRALMLVAEDERANGEILIATDGKHYSSREIYEVMCDISGKSAPSWGVPKIFFDILALLSPSIRYKVKKLLGDEYYSSEKLESLGFKAQFSLREINETSF